MMSILQYSQLELGSFSRTLFRTCPVLIRLLTKIRNNMTRNDIEMTRLLARCQRDSKHSEKMCVVSLVFYWEIVTIPITPLLARCQRGFQVYCDNWYHCSRILLQKGGISKTLILARCQRVLNQFAIIHDHFASSQVIFFNTEHIASICYILTSFWALCNHLP